MNDVWDVVFTVQDNRRQLIQFAAPENHQMGFGEGLGTHITLSQKNIPGGAYIFLANWKEVASFVSLKVNLYGQLSI